LTVKDVAGAAMDDGPGSEIDHKYASLNIIKSTATDARGAAGNGGLRCRRPNNARKFLQSMSASKTRSTDRH